MKLTESKALSAVAVVFAFSFIGLARFFAGLYCYYLYYGNSLFDRLDCPSAA